MPETPTPRLGLYRPKADGSENVNVLTDLNNNYDKLDQYVGWMTVPTQAARLAVAGFVGQAVRQADTGALYVLTALPASVAGNWLAVQTGAESPIVVADQAARDALVKANGLEIWRTDRKWVEVCDGAAWRVQGVPIVVSVADLAAITNPVAGMVAWNTGDAKMYAYVGGAWVRQGAGYITHSERTVNSAGVTTVETLVDSKTFTAAAGRFHKLTWEGLYSSSSAGDNGIVNLRYAAGATVTNTSTFADGKLVQPTVANTNVPVTLIVPHLALPAGQVTVGAFIVRNFGAGTHTAQAGTGWKTKLIIEDDGS